MFATILSAISKRINIGRGGGGEGCNYNKALVHERGTLYQGQTRTRVALRVDDTARIAENIISREHKSQYKELARKTSLEVSISENVKMRRF